MTTSTPPEARELDDILMDLLTKNYETKRDEYGFDVIQNAETAIEKATGSIEAYIAQNYRSTPDILKAIDGEPGATIPYTNKQDNFDTGYLTAIRDIKQRLGL